MWSNIVSSLYPDALRRTYCVPPVHFFHVPLVRRTVHGTGQSAFMYTPSLGTGPPVHDVPHTSPQPTQSARYSLWTLESQSRVPVRVLDSDIQDDFGQNHLLYNLQELGMKGAEPMFILSQFNFSNYLNQPTYAAVVAVAKLPTPRGLNQTFHQGEFDILLIHRQYGLLILELKTVGRSKAKGSTRQAPADADVTKRVNKAVKQLDKLETVVKHLMNDIAPALVVRKTICLPYVTSAQLQRVLSANQPLKQVVCRSLGAADAAEATQLCLCSDQLSDPATYWDVTPAVLSQLTAWWQRRMACTKDPLLTDTLYLDIVARFVGPASTMAVHCSSPPRVEVRSEGEAVQELGRRMARLVLTPSQLDLMNRDPPLVCLTGPPGTGKTLLLILEGLRWLRQGQDVQVVSTMDSTLAASHLIKYQLEMTAREELGGTVAASPVRGTVYLRCYDFYNREDDVDRALTDLLSAAKHKAPLCTLLDEASFNVNASRGPRLKRLVAVLIATTPQLRLWTAGVRHVDIPKQLQTEVLTTALRSTPVVLREVRRGLARFPVHDYSDGGVPAPGDGLQVGRLYHQGNSHTGSLLHDCPQCGKDVAAELRHLGVGQKGNCVAWRDVFVLTRNDDLHDDVRNDRGVVTSQASGVVQGLRKAGVPVGVLGWGDRDRNRWKWEKDVAEVAAAGRDQVTVAYNGAVIGLERKVVVALSGRGQFDDSAGFNEGEVDAHDRLHALSRSSTHLITITIPAKP